jgi:8-oxo-dGTP pyrophosphatase MutT (NUDIX family)
MMLLDQPKIGMSVLHVTWLNDDAVVMYDQLLVCERGGGVFIPIDTTNRRIGLVKAWRPVTTSQERWLADWPDIDPTALGRVSYELPRGMASVSDASGDAAAVREAEEETGSAVISSKSLCFVNSNTALNPHMTAVAYGHIDINKRGRYAADPNEQILGKLTFFDRDGLNELMHRGDLFCALTLGALGALLLESPTII